MVCGRLEGDILYVLLLGPQSHRVWECGQAVCQEHFGPHSVAIFVQGNACVSLLKLILLKLLKNYYFETTSHYVWSEFSLCSSGWVEVTVFLLQLPNGWDPRHETSCPVLLRCFILLYFLFC